MENFDVIIIGGGAAGLMCAITAGQRGKSVLLIEHSKRVGRKILMSGGGRCNFTNLHIQADNFLSANPHFCKSALGQYTQWNFIDLVEKHDIAYYEKTFGQLFCKESAKQIVTMLLAECSSAHVQINTQCCVEKVSVEKAIDKKTINEKTSAEQSYRVQTNHGIFSASSLVIATGGLSIPTMGATDFAYKVAKQFSLSVLPTRAALVPMTLSGQLKLMSERLSGVALPVIAKVSIIKAPKKSFSEGLLFTHRGLSGPAILQISSYWQLGNELLLNLLPNEDVLKLLLEAKRTQPNVFLKTILNKHLPKAVVLELEMMFWKECADQPLQHYDNKQLSNIANKLEQWHIKPSGTEGYRTAEVTLGGVDTKHFSSKTMECKSQSGLYFIGEALDVTGHLGGYNFQWAWSSAYAAGLSV